MEDNRADVFLVEEALSAHGIDAHLQVVTDGEDGIRHLEARSSQTHLDLVILDLNLPKRSGTEVLAYIRSKPEYATVPVLIMTSSGSEMDRRQTASLGCSAYFRKPSSFDAFLSLGLVIKSLLDPSA